MKLSKLPVLTLAFLLSCGAGQRAFAQQPPAAPASPVAPPVSPTTPTTPPAAPHAPTGPELVAKGTVALTQGKFDDAIAAFKQALALNAKDLDALSGLGKAYEGAKKYPEAIQTFQSAIDINPGVASYHFGLGTSLLESGKYSPARTSLERAVELDPNDLRSRLFIGESYLREQDYESARSAFLNALGYAPDNPAIHDELGKVNTQENRNSDALDEYETSLRIDSKDVDALLGRATALSGLKRHVEAEKAMRALVTQFPKEVFSHSGLAQVLDAANKHEDAIAEYQAALQMQPTDAYLWGNLGWSQYGAGRYDDSIKSSRKALEIDPKLSYVRFNVGLVYAAQNHWTEAQKEYSTAISGATSSDIHAALTDVKTALTKQPNASALKKSLDYLSSAERKAILTPVSGTTPNNS